MPRRSAPYQPAAPATTTQASRIRPRGNSLAATTTARTIVAAPTTSVMAAASRRLMRSFPRERGELARGRRPRRPRDLRGDRSHADPRARSGDEPAVARRRLLEALAALGDGARARGRAERASRRRRRPRVARGHVDSSSTWRSSRSGAGGAPTGWRETCRSRGTCGCRSRARSHPGTPRPPSRSRPASGTCRPSAAVPLRALAAAGRLLARPHRRALSRRRAGRRPDRHDARAAHGACGDRLRG